MDPILKIVNYLFKKRNNATKVETFDSIFDNGITFPQFIALVFNIDSIPSINSNPKTIYHQKVNNTLAVQYLFKNNLDIAKISPSFNTERDKANLIALILTKQCFKINYQDIINKCNLIVRSLGIQFTKKSELLDKKCILALLNVLTDNDVKLDEEADTFDDLMSKIFTKAKVPLVINKSSLEIQNQFTFFIQIEIIFDYFSNKIDKLIGNKDQKSEENEIEIEEKNSIEKFVNFSDSDSDDEDDFEKIDESALLRVINAIGESDNIHFSTMIQSIEKDNLPKFVRIFLNDEIDLKTINNIIENAGNEKVKEVIQYLGETRKPNQPIFKLLRFNINDEKFRLQSSILFYTNFLDTYFLKASKNKLLERCTTILFGNIERDDAFYLMYIKNIDKNKIPYDDRKLLLKWDTYLALVNFVNTNDTHYQIDRTKKDEAYFKQNNVTQIINESYLKKFSKKVPDIVYYQLQFIFNVLDTKSSSYRLHENFLKAERKIKKLKVPSFTNLVNTIKRKYKTNAATASNANADKSAGVETFIQRKNKNSELLKKLAGEGKSAESFWNPIDKVTFIDRGVLCQSKKNIRAQRLWFDEIINFHSNISIINYSIETPRKLFTEVPIENARSKLYKFFYYDDDLKQWQLDSNKVKEFIEDKQYANTKTPLVLFSNSYEKDIITINSKFIKSIYPDLDDDNIYIYAISDKELSLLHFNLTFSEEKESEKVNPIFLLLHIPKSLKKHEDIKAIIFKIYYFLSIICDIEVVVLNKEHCLEQLDLIKEINNIKSSYENSATEKLNDPLKKLNENFEMNIALEKADFNIWKKKSNYIILLNDDTIKGDIAKPDESDFIKYIKRKIDSEFVNVHHINIFEPITYRGFLSSLIKFASKVSNDFDQTLNSFNLFPLANIGTLYVNLKSKDDWKNKLKKVIDERFNQLIEVDCGQSSEFVILSNLNNEIEKYCPFIDSEFIDECNSNLNKIRHLITKKNQRLIKLELHSSSENNLAYLEKVINEKSPISDVESSHTNFLKDEFFNIINNLYEMDNPKQVLNDNQTILEDQIQLDVRKINSKYQV